MHFPCTREELRHAGYSFKHSRACKLCEAELEFWLTPKHALAPLEVLVIDGEWLMGSHFATCPFAKEFHKKSQKSVEQKELFQ